jgi:hypothetical protein
VIFLNSDSSKIEIWRNRFYKTGDFLDILYKMTFDKTRGRVKRDLLLYSSQAEETEEYLWVYLDYGIRTPVYRTLQYLGTAYPPKDKWKDVVENSRVEDQEVITSFISDLTAHIRKEYTLTWSKILNRIYDMLRKDYQLLNRIKDAIGLNKDQMNKGIEDVKGLESELKAVYVLVDHGKSFLPFSIMQAPMTPSFIESWPASGDLYLFEENLVVDVKSGWLDEETELPIYKYGKPNRDLPGGLEEIRDIGRLHGVRKGIGVLADYKGYFYLAIYVPWRDWRTQGPLLLLKSARLPFIIYMNNIEYTGAQRGVKPHKAVIEGNKLRLTISAYDVREQVSSEERKKGIGGEDMTLEFPGDPGVQVKGVTSWSKRGDKKFTIEFEVEADKVKKSIIEYGGRRIIMTRLLVKHGKTGDRLIYPVLAVTE